MKLLVFAALLAFTFAVVANAQSSSGMNSGSHSTSEAGTDSSASAASTGGAHANTAYTPGLDVLLLRSYYVNAGAMDCVNDNPTEILCNLTAECYWDNSSTPPLCLAKANETTENNSTVENNDAWCVGHFPTPVITTVYMVAAFVMGFAFSGVIYNGLWYDVYSRVNDVGERQFNQFYHRTAFMNIYSIFIVLVSVFMFIFTFVNQFYDDQSCIYIFFTYAFIIGFFIPAVALPTWIFMLWVLKKCKSGPKTDLTLDEWCVPRTAEALKDPRNCQTRCF